MKIWLNGVSAEHISLRDRGLQFGDGVFRTMRCCGGEIALFDTQYARLQQDADKLGIAVPDKAILQQWLQPASQLPGAVVIKVVLTRGESERGYAVPAGTRPNCVIYAHPVPAAGRQWRDEGIAALICTTRLAVQPALAGIKHLNRLENVIARREWDDGAIVEGLMLDTDGWVVEGVMSNLFFVRRGMLCTPDLGRCGVAGVMRSEIMRQRETAIGQFDLGTLWEADEAFVCNSVMGIVPLRRIGERNLPIGPVTRGLQELWIDTFAE